MKSRLFLVLIAFSVLCAFSPAQEGKSYITDTSNGFRIHKPPKKEHWEVKPPVEGNNINATINNRVKALRVMVFAQAAPQGRREAFGKLDKIVSDIIKGLEGQEAVKRVKVRKKVLKTKFPCRNKPPAAAYIDLEIIKKDDTKEWQRRYIFYGNQGNNKNLFQIIIPGDDATYKKYQRDVKVILYMFEILKTKR